MDSFQGFFSVVGASGAVFSNKTASDHALVKTPTDFFPLSSVPVYVTGKSKYFFPTFHGNIFVAQADRSDWTCLNTTPGLVFNVTPTVVPMADGRVVLFAVNSKDCMIYYKIGQEDAKEPKLNFAEWRNHSGAGTLSAVGACSSTTSIHLLLRATDNTIYYSWMSLAAAEPVVHPWTLVPHSGLTIDAPAIALLPCGADLRILLVVRGTDDSLFSKTCTAGGPAGGGTWSAWSRLAAKTVSAPAAACLLDGTARVFVRGADNMLYHGVFNADGSGLLVFNPVETPELVVQAPCFLAPIKQ